jgi:hypothetical protein
MKKKVLVLLASALLLLQGVACPPKPTPTPIIIVVTPTPIEAPPTPTEVPATPTPSPIPTPAAREVEVHPLAFAIGPEGPYGMTSRCKVSVEPNPERELRVGFYEEEVAGTGPMWRSSGWMASIVGSFLMGVDLAEYRFTFDIGGRIDGPSAGGLMTVAVLACLLGDEVKEEASMTGTINPDGTIGPVGGIPQKIEGAVEAGKKLVLVPVGQRYSFDIAKQEWVDVVEHGRRLGVEVKEVSDIYQAYEILTGKELPKPEGAKDERPELPPGAFDRVRAKAREWYARYSEIRAEYDAIDDAFKLDVEMMALADESARKSDNYFGQGMMMSAYGEALEAALYATSAYETARLTEVLLTSGVDAAIDHVRAKSAVETKITALLERLRVEKPRTLDDVIALGEAYGNLSLAMGLKDMALSVLSWEAETEEELLSQIYLSDFFFAITDHAIELSEDAIEIGMGFGAVPAPSEEEVGRIAEVLRRATEANINYFETVILEEIAEALGVHPKVIKRAFMGQEFSYTFALSSLNAIPLIEEKFGPGLEINYAVLGASLGSYQLSSLLLAKYYSLDAEVDETGKIVSVKREKALIELFDFVERRTRETIALARSVGCEPVHPILYYEFAKGLREGDMEDKFMALEYFWLASTQAQAMAILSGAARLVP